MKPPKHLEILGLLCIFSIFLDRAVRGVLPFDLYLNYPIFILFMLAQIQHTGRIIVPPRWFNWSVLFIAVISFINTAMRGLLGFEFYKQVLGIMFTATVYYNVMHVFKFNVRIIFRYYLKFAYWVAAFGVFDNLLHILGIHITNNNQAGAFQYREYSIMGEPFYLAMALTPAIVYYLVYFNRVWKEERFKLIVIMLCYFVTYSSIALTGFGLGILISLYLNNFFSIRSNRIAVIPIVAVPVILLFTSLINNVELFKLRFNDTTNLFLSSRIETEQAGRSNSSTFALYSNYIIARDSFFDNPMFGSGLGSHPLIYTETFLKYFPSKYLDNFGAQNQQDANSKFLRLMSETGLVGTILFLIGVFKFRLGNNYPKEFLEDIAINNGIFVFIILGLIRNGNYINIGFFLLYFLYYYSYRHVTTRSAAASRPSTKPGAVAVAISS